MNPVETGGISPKLKSVTGSNCAENPQRFPRVNAPIREGSVTEGSECRAREDIPEIGCREGLEAAAPSTVKESPRRPCSGGGERSAGLTGGRHGFRTLQERNSCVS